ncbi:MAG TPA: hypothetical protein VGO52_08480 [Hyphomonadaceae bacterium]|jgi:hypothetical protein|nr:hypothetical protein [Hyphomonadaceae bacterium]
MPLHAQIACIGGNCFFALIFLIAAGQGLSANEMGMAAFMAALAACAVYTAWVLLKFRKYLSAEDSIARELAMERMQEEIDQLKANNTPESR